MDERKLADRIAADIFEAGSDPDRGSAGTVHRIAFKAGRYPNDEIELGGCCQSVLADLIHQSIIYARDEKGQTENG